MKDTDIADRIRSAVAELNDALSTAARAGLVVELATKTHQTTGGMEQTVVEARIYRQL